MPRAASLPVRAHNHNARGGAIIELSDVYPAATLRPGVLAHSAFYSKVPCNIPCIVSKVPCNVP